MTSMPMIDRSITCDIVSCERCERRVRAGHLPPLFMRAKMRLSRMKNSKQLSTAKSKPFSPETTSGHSASALQS
ncbi:uncharacterized protein DSM5745_02476 [Aspergillus mulundensis]|uniref:Uncharacterized protein n=1 Tax=Aspergillus mulundensis TaxID=1810919 RepID=A0A3D8SX12_9EURO|nr:hypothetical protein DSM5745_02476 [Aspergillus mulundensis]RDW90701.1 hypothetical protein DSM5745_02476 [Aspergillus mulundensis]